MNSSFCPFSSDAFDCESATYAQANTSLCEAFCAQANYSVLKVQLERLQVLNCSVGVGVAEEDEQVKSICKHSLLVVRQSFINYLIDYTVSTQTDVILFISLIQSS